MAKLSPIGNNAQFINGVPAVGAKIFTYAAGSSTKQTTYTDEAGTIPQTNPIILDSRGEPTQPIWLTEGLSYDFVFTASTDSDPPTSPIWDVPDVTGVNDASLVIDQWVDSGVTPTYVSAIQFTLPGDQTSAFTVNRRVKVLVTAGTAYGYISASVFGALTTVTVVMDSTPLDSGLSSVQLGLLTPNNTSLFLIQNANLADAYITDSTAVTIASNDYVAIADTSDSNKKKKALVSDILALAAPVYASNAEYVTGTETNKPLNPAVARARNLVAGTAIATTSGTSHDFTGIPSWVKRITINYQSLSSNGTSIPIVQLGDSGGIETTGYLGAGSVTTGGGTGSNFTTGFGLTNSSGWLATSVLHGSLVLTLLDSTNNTWIASGTSGYSSSTFTSATGGSKSLSATLDRIRLTTVNGTDTFDAGSFNIIYE
jgi:hypothetical protein